jgi:hypothetical protein
MGANCPSAVPLLLRGCIDAYQRAHVAHSRHWNIIKVAKAAVTALADLSDREKTRIWTTLQKDGIMLDVQLSLAMSQDPISASCLLLQYLTAADHRGGAERREAPYRNGGDVKKPENYGVDTELNWRSTSLKALLEDNPKLLTRTLHFLKSQLSSQIQKEGLPTALGQVWILLRCYTWLLWLCDVSKAAQNSDDRGLPLATSLLQLLQSLVDKICGSKDGSNSNTIIASLSVEKTLCLSLCASLVSFARLTSLDLHTKAREQSEEYVKSCFACRSINAKYDILLARFASSLKDGSAEAICDLIKSALEKSLCAKSSGLEANATLERGLVSFREWAAEKLDLDVLLKVETPSDSAVDPAAMLDLMRCSKDTGNVTGKKVIDALKLILCESNCSTSLGHEQIPQFIVEATAFLSKYNAINLPIISPLKLEGRATKLDLHLLKEDSILGTPEYQFLLQVLYWFAYVDAETSTVLSFDARTLPLKEVLSCSGRLAACSKNATSLNFHLNKLVAKHCPEIPLQVRRWELIRHARVNLASKQPKFDSRSLKKKLSQSLKSCLIGPTPDNAGLVAEKTFLVARGQLSDADLYTTAVSTLLSTPNSPPPFYTYSMLCRDPLLLLKVPICVWQCQSLRHIVLSILSSLIETNQAIVEVASPSGTGADDLTASRNLLLLRCLLIAVGGTEETEPGHSPYLCSTTSHFVRMMVARYRGLVGMLVKQSPALPDCALDWLVEFVPETMDDTQALVSVLAERGSLTARLSAAAAILRIAIAHGHRDESATEPLVYAALAQLVSSFFLVIGPVGVPVNVLIGDGSGRDVTQTARKATFRMLRSLLNVRGRQRSRIRNECGMALHKLAGLCKGENILSGVAGAVVSRRKNLLREIFDAVTKAANAMGSGIDL